MTIQSADKIVAWGYSPKKIVVFLCLNVWENLKIRQSDSVDHIGLITLVWSHWFDHIG